jgi:hypothetical protein
MYLWAIIEPYDEYYMLVLYIIARRITNDVTTLIMRRLVTAVTWRQAAWQNLEGGPAKHSAYVAHDEQAWAPQISLIYKRDAFPIVP